MSNIQAATKETLQDSTNFQLTNKQTNRQTNKQTSYFLCFTPGTLDQFHCQFANLFCWHRQATMPTPSSPSYPSKSGPNDHLNSVANNTNETVKITPPFPVSEFMLFQVLSSTCIKVFCTLFSELRITEKMLWTLPDILMRF